MTYTGRMLAPDTKQIICLSDMASMPRHQIKLFSQLKSEALQWRAPE